MKINIKIKKQIYLFCFLNIFLVFHIKPKLAFSSKTSSLEVKSSNSKVIISNASKVTGITQQSIVRNNSSSPSNQWRAQTLANNDIISFDSGYTEKPPMALLYATSNTLYYFGSTYDILTGTVRATSRLNYTTSNVIIKNISDIRFNSNALLSYADFTQTETTLINGELRANSRLGLFKNNSNALLYGISNDSNSLNYGIKNNSNALIYLTKNNSNALIFGIKNNSNAIIKNVYDNANNINAINFINNQRLIYEGLDGTANPKYNTQNWVFKSPSTAKGFVYFCNGFTVMPNSTAFMDTFITISGPIDLRETGSLDLLNDLHFDSNVTLSSGGYINGRGNALFLDGDLTVTSVLHISGNLIIDGQGHNLYFGKDSRDIASHIFVDNDITLTLRNLTIKQLSSSTDYPTTYPPIKLATPKSKLALDNVKIAPLSDFLFDRGQLYIYNDVMFTGTSSFIYWSPDTSYITPNSCLYFDKQTTFSFAPATLQSNAKDLLVLQDKTSSLFFDGCSLKSTSTGLRLTKGSAYFDNKINLHSYTDMVIQKLSIQNTITDYLNECYQVSWSPDSKYLAIGGYDSSKAIQIYTFNGTNLNLLTQVTDYGVDCESVAWSPDGKYLAIGGGTPSKAIQVYGFNGSKLNLLSTISSYSFSEFCYEVSWSPDGKYLATASDAVYSAGVKSEVQVYSFNGTSLNVIPSAMIMYNAPFYSISWHPDGKHLAIAGNGNGEPIQVLSFDGINLNSICVINDYGAECESVSWSSDGKYLAVGGDDGNKAIQVYSFDGTSLNLVTEDTNYGSACYAVGWNPSGKYLAIGGYATYSAGIRGQIQVYNFNGTSLNLLSSSIINYGDGCRSVAWRPNGNVLAIAGVVGNQAIQVYSAPFSSFNPTLQSMENGITFGNKNLGSYYNLNTRFLGNAFIEINGIVNDDSI